MQAAFLDLNSSPIRTTNAKHVEVDWSADDDYEKQKKIKYRLDVIERILELALQMADEGLNMLRELDLN